MPVSVPANYAVCVCLGMCDGIPDVPGAGTPGYRQWRPPERPIPLGHCGAGHKNTTLGNLDIRIPVVQNPAGHPRREEDDAEVEEKTGEDDAETEEPTEEDDAGTEGKTEREDAETGQKPCDGPHEERSRPEQLTPRGNLDKGQGSLETPRLRHVPGGAWLQQSDDLPYLLSFPGYPGDAIPPRDLQRDSRRPEREKRKEEVTTRREKDSSTDREDL
ncbi:hypothetical protein NDU88_005007 [Pleurodeles waltl]|uniref:Uncharacterized protein n=1 Tax=Pleurodeles waltl TaxID=8319 RepID=A0AAV7TTJ8_PLEWA|nr:hypothetical protein NDU88_005007 [Pleurodeles waltl]